MTDQIGGVREEIPQRSSYVNDINGQQGRSYEATASRSGVRHGLSTVGRSSKKNSYDDYGQVPVRQDSNYDRYDANNSDWRIQK